MVTQDAHAKVEGLALTTQSTLPLSEFYVEGRVPYKRRISRKPLHVTIQHPPCTWTYKRFFIFGRVTMIDES